MEEIAQEALVQLHRHMLVEGVRLVLTFVWTSEPATRGVLDEVHQRALCAAVPFTRTE